MNVLVINAGSSSLKFELLNINNETVLAKGMVERIGGFSGAMLKYKPSGKENQLIKQNLKDHTEAMKVVLDALIHPEYGVIGALDEISAIGHRIVHGGEKYSSSIIIDDEVIKTIDELSEIAPLHNPANLMGINACKDIMPGVPMVGVFDTAFHQTMPPKAFMYALPYEDYEKHKIRRYGFHGSSHRYVSRMAAQMLGKPIEETKIITCHLGNGSSISAILGGKSVDTSMGYTPLEGVPMGTRSGSVDPGIVMLLADKGYSISEINTYLNKKSGMLGLSGVSSDFRDLWDAADAGNERAKMALDVFSYNVKKYVGAYAAVMNGVDAIVFTAGIGENDYLVRQAVLMDMEYLGLDVNHELVAQDLRGQTLTLTNPNSKVKAFVIPTEEELVIARDTAKLVGNK